MFGHHSKTVALDCNVQALLIKDGRQNPDSVPILGLKFHSVTAATTLSTSQPLRL